MGKLAVEKEGQAMSLDVLLVEDEPAFRNVIARNIVGRGHRVREACNAAEAIEMATQQLPSLVLLDINLPDRSGLDVLRELHSRGVDIPTVVVSAVRVSPMKLAEFHPLAYLPKPFPLEALLRIVEEVDEARRGTGVPRASVSEEGVWHWPM